VFSTVGYFLPRLMFLNARYAPQVHWGDIALALDGLHAESLDLASAGFWDRWRGGWRGQAQRYERLAAESSTPAGRARALRGAAACYHWAEFMDFDDPGRKHALRSRIRDCFLASTELELISGALPGPQPVPYWLVMPPAHRPAGRLPCVVLCNGLDSMTEVEILSLAEPHLERGYAALVFDGPGQGIQVGQVPLLIEMERVVAGLVEVLRADPRIDASRLAFLGVSFGGYLALRVAQRLGEAFRCVVNLSGGPRIAPFAGLPRRLKDDFRFAFCAGLDRADDSEMQARFDALAVNPAEPAGTDVLSIHGALDDIFPLPFLRELDLGWGPRHRLVVYDREAHVCLNLINECTLRAADWVADHLVVPAYLQEVS
jgi:pimeloyl-ACP methyl ester carboxylesterase